MIQFSSTINSFQSAFQHVIKLDLNNMKDADWKTFNQNMNFNIEYNFNKIIINKFY